MRQNAKSKSKQRLTVVGDIPVDINTKPREMSKRSVKDDPTISANQGRVPKKVSTGAKRVVDASPDSLREPTRPTTKKDQLIALLSTKSGADVASISATLGWQRHTTRAALTMLRKAGYAIEAIKPEDGGGGLYRVVAHPPASRDTA